MKCVSSRHSLRIPLHPLHHIPPMDQTDGMDVHFRGVEAISRKIMAKHRLLRQMSDFGPILDDEVSFSRLSTPNQVHHLHRDPPKDLTERRNTHIWGVEAISRKIMAKHRLLRQMSDSGPILDEEVSFSRTRPPNHENHLHHDSPMEPRERLNMNFCGVEAISRKRMAINLILRRLPDFRPLGRRICDLSPPDKNSVQIIKSVCYPGTIGND